MKTPQALNRFARPRSLQVLIFVLVLLLLTLSFVGWRDHAGREKWGGKAVLAAKAHSASPVREAIAHKLKTQAKVKVELFVMSQCPFGVRAEEAMAPVLEEFGQQVEFQLRFIAAPSNDGFASLHGQPEVDEDIRQVVMAQQFPEQYFDYVVARAANYRSSEWQPAAVAAGIDVDTVERLARSAVGKRLFAENIRRANELRIGASPTILLDGAKYQGRIMALAPAGAAANKAFGAVTKPVAAQPLPTPQPGTGTWQAPAWQNWFSPLWAKASAVVQSGLSGLGLTSVSSVNNSRTAGSTGLLAPTITATKSATLPNTGCPSNGLFDLNCNGLVNPGDTLMYSILLHNTGTDALNVVFTDTLNANLAFVPGSLSATPLAQPDSYTTSFNKQLEVAAVQTVPAAVFVNGNVRANDIDPRGGTLTITPLSNSPTTQGGTVTLSNTGTFLYTPLNNFSGADTFTYTATNTQGKTDTATVAITVNPQICGNGITEGSEVCDDNNTVNGDGCSAACSVETGYTCTGSPSVCAATCGDGIKAGGESCDDHNTTNGDGCSAACAVETGYICMGTTPSVCASTCGDGIKASNEACDDHNTASGDGCSSGCSVEAG